jgi:hypothetical protein
MAFTRYMVNEEHDPSDGEEKILDILKDGRDEGEPWGYASPRYLRKVTDFTEGNIDFYLRQLKSAGWIKKEVRGLYRYVDDPRENNETENSG